MATIPLMIRVETEAERLLRQWAPGRKGLGRVVSRLVYEEQVRRQERQQLAQRLDALKNGLTDVE